MNLCKVPLRLLTCILILTAFSCSNEDTIGSDEALNPSYNFGTTVGSCTYLDPNRITAPLWPYNSWENGVVSFCGPAMYECFSDRLRKSVQNEFVKSSKGGPSVSTNYAKSYGIHLSTIESNPGLVLSPVISAEDANKIYRYMVCEIQTYFDTLPALSGNQYYVPKATYVDLTHPYNQLWDLSYLSFYMDVVIATDE